MTAKYRVLVVDDTTTIRMQIRSFLEPEFECVLAAAGADGLKEAILRPPDAIIADIEMPGMTGVEFLTQLKKDPKTQAVPVIMCTTVTQVDNVNQCRALGCVGYVLKPVNGDYLRAKLRQVLVKK